MGLRITKRHKSILISIFLITSIWLLAVTPIFRTPVVGIADNGDFYRVINPIGLEKIGGLGGGDPVLLTEYSKQRPIVRRLSSSASIVPFLIKEFHTFLFGISKNLNIQILGITLSVLFLFCMLVAHFYLLIPISTIGVICFIFSDPSYLLYLNSFLSEGTVFISLFLLICFLISHRQKKSKLLLYFIFFIFLFTKHHFAILGLPFFVFYSLLHRRTDFGLLVIALVALYFSFFSLNQFRKINIFLPNAFNRFASGPAALSDNPTKVLINLNLKPEYQKYVNANFWSLNLADKNTSVELKEIIKVPIHAIAFEYFKDSSVLSRISVKALDAVAFSKINTAAHYSEKSHPMQRFRRAISFRDFLEECFSKYKIATWLILMFFVLSAFCISKRRIRYSMVFLCFSTLLIVSSSILGDGLWDFERHTLLARFCFDILIGLSIYSIMQHCYYYFSSTRFIHQRKFLSITEEKG